MIKFAVVALVLALTLSSAKQVNVGQFSYGLAAAGGSVWVGGLGTGDVARVSPGGTVTAHVTVGPRVFNLAAAPGAVWAISNVSNVAVRIDARTGKVTNKVAVGYAPYDIEWGFGSAWVSNSGDGTVARITNGRVVTSIKVGTEPNGLTAYGGSLWVTDHTDGKLLRIDPKTNRITGRVTLSGADWVTGIGNALYISQETNVVARVDTKTLKVTGVAKVDRNPLGSAVVNGRLWVPCIDANKVDIVDPGTMKVISKRAAGPGPIVVLPAFGHIWVSHTTGNFVSRL